MCRQNFQAVQSSAMHTGNNAAIPQVGVTPQTLRGYTQGQYTFQQPLPPQTQHNMRTPPLSIPQSQSSSAMGNFSFQPQVQQHNVPQQTQSLPPQFSPEGQQSLHINIRAPQQCLTPEGETGIASYNTQSSQLQTTLPTGNVQPLQGDVSGTMCSVQGEHGFIAANNDYNFNGFNPTPPASESPQPTPHVPRSRPFQHPRCLAAEEWERQKRDEDADNELIDELMELVGLEKVKEQVLAIKDKVEVYEKQGTDIKKERFNVIFQGNPGTGQPLSLFLLRSVHQIFDCTCWWLTPACNRKNHRCPPVRQFSPLHRRPRVRLRRGDIWEQVGCRRSERCQTNAG